jgi:predicted TIM-barrel fold metal-dependent hydrolase
VDSGAGRRQPEPRPGALRDAYRGASDSISSALMAEDPKKHAEWFNRDARLAVMDAQGVEAAWMFPSRGVCMEGPMQPDIEAILDIFHAFNRWIDEEWGFAYKDRIFAAPYLTLSDLDCAMSELAWVVDRGARVVALRPGPVFTPAGWKSPADPVFDPFWSLVDEARLVVAVHPGFDDGYRDVEDAVARSWGYESRRRPGAVSSLNFYEPFIEAVMHDRLLHDFMVALVAHGLFERHPGLRVASIENGAAWIPGIMASLRRFRRASRSALRTDPVEQFREHVWVTPFVADTVPGCSSTCPWSVFCSVPIGPMRRVSPSRRSTSTTSSGSQSRTSAESCVTMLVN